MIANDNRGGYKRLFASHIVFSLRLNERDSFLIVSEENILAQCIVVNLVANSRLHERLRVINEKVRSREHQQGMIHLGYIHLRNKIALDSLMNQCRKQQKSSIILWGHFLCISNYPLIIVEHFVKEARTSCVSQMAYL